MQVQISELVKRLRAARLRAGLTTDVVEDTLVLGRGWVDRVESGKEQPPLDLLLAMSQVVKADLSELVKDLPAPSVPTFQRTLTAIPQGKNIVFNFPFGKHNSRYVINDATKKQTEEVLEVLRSGLGRTETPEAVEQEEALGDTGGGDPVALPAAVEKARVVADTFLKATQVWPKVNPSDLWYFIIAKAYLDPYNHPADFARGDLAQSWKRTGGWALEYIFLNHYQAVLAEHNVGIIMPAQDVKRDLIGRMNLGNDVNPDKADLLFVHESKNGMQECFGVGHVKASFAERRTDDVPLSEALIRRGYLSPLITMDCKGSPGVNAYNKGELGPVQSPEDKKVKVSEKRLDIERDKKFDACFSYNTNTLATPSGTSASARIKICGFQNPNDAFVAHVVKAKEARYDN